MNPFSCTIASSTSQLGNARGRGVPLHCLAQSLRIYSAGEVIPGLVRCAQREHLRRMPLLTFSLSDSAAMQLDQSAVKGLGWAQGEQKGLFSGLPILSGTR